MSTTTDWSYRPGRGEAHVALHDAGVEGRPVAVVSWSGDEHLIPHVPSAYFDKIFCNLRNDESAAADLLERVVRFVGGMDEGDWDSLLAGRADYDRLTIPGKGGTPLPAAALRDESASKPNARVRAKMVATDFILGATTHFKPIFRGQNPTVAELVFWALWDWMTLFLLGAKEHDVLARSFNSFSYQLNHYRRHGIPGFTEMGSVPFLAATTDATDEAPPGDLEDLIGRVRHGLADLATDEEGTPRAYPEWAIRRFVKSQIVSEFGLLDDQVMASFEAMRSTDEADREAATARYEAQLDRVLNENDLASIVPAVIAAVATRTPDE